LTFVFIYIEYVYMLIYYYYLLTPIVYTNGRYIILIY